jgi:type IX secretion system PorP/SprF family membrane protein
MKKYYCLLFLLALVKLSFGQDYVLNQYQQVPLLLNPALTGSSCGVRITSFYYHTSFFSATTYQTYGVAIDAPFHLKNNFKLGVGYGYSADVAGETKFGGRNHTLSAAISKSIKRTSVNHSFSLGIQTALAQRSLDGGGLRWPSQIGKDGFNPDLPSGEPSFNFNVRYFDINGGLGWKADFKNKNSMAAGVAFFHLNRPDISFITSNVTLNRRMTVYLVGEYSVLKNITILPSVYYTKQGTQDLYNLSFGTKYLINKDASIALIGGYVKNNRSWLGLNFNVGRFSMSGTYGIENVDLFKKIEFTTSFILNSKNCIE